uniref:Sarcoglycan zeta n=1 Tax=Astyanax mexicanus TaxID=7994 RepID=A0A3B1J821_ASTMX
MTQEQYILASQPGSLQRPGCPAPYPVGIYGWRKRCLYFFILLLLVTMIVNLALTIWILKVMNFTVESPLILQSDRNVTVNARNDLGQLTGQLTVGSELVEAQCQRFEVRSADGERVLFSADENEVSIGTEKLRVTGDEGVVFGHSVETPHIRAEPFQDLKLESPTRTLTLEAPKGVEVNAGVGEFRIFLNANSIRLGNLPHGSVDPLLGPGTSYPKQTVYEVCVCPSGKLYLSPGREQSSTYNICTYSGLRKYILSSLSS